MILTRTEAARVLARAGLEMLPPHWRLAVADDTIREYAERAVRVLEAAGYGIAALPVPPSPPGRRPRQSAPPGEP